MLTAGEQIAAARRLIRRWSPWVWLVLLAAAVVVAAPGWWVDLAAVGTVGLRRFWLPAVLAAAGLLGLGGWYRRWRAAVRPARPLAGARRWPLFGNVAVLLLAAVLAAAAAGALLWWVLGTPDVGATPTPASSKPPAGASPADTATGGGWTVQNTFDAIKIVLAVVAGIGGVVALTVAYRKQHHGEAAEHREDTKLFNERFGRAADQLGADKAAVRLAGIYALTGLADDWVEGRQSCIDVLCAYLRMPYTPPADDLSDATPAVAVLEELPLPVRPQSDDDAARRQERQVRHTILAVIGEHLQPAHSRDFRPRWHGHRFDLRGAVLDGGDLASIDVPDGTLLDFSHATFPAGTVSFGRAAFSGGTVHFGHATFSGGTVYFGGATFSGGEVGFGHAVFSGGTVYFRGVAFSGGTVYFGRAAFSGGTVYFGHAVFSGGTVDFSVAAFSGGTVGFVSAMFSDGEVDFSSAAFSGGEVDFIRAAFSGGEVDFSDATLLHGTVSFKTPRDWRVPPRGLDGSEPGVVWPSPEDLAKISSEPA